MDEAQEAFNQHELPQENLQERETYSPPASPTDSIYSQGHESEKHGSPRSRSRSGSPASLRSEGQNISPPASPSPDSPAVDKTNSPAGVRSRSLSPVDDDNADDVLTTGRRGSVEDRSGGGSPRSRSASGSPARSGSPAGSPPRSRSGSRSRSPSPVPAEIRSRSPSVSGRSRSTSPVVAGRNSPSHSRSPSLRSRSRSGSPGGRSGSPGSSRSRSVSPAHSRSRSHSPPHSRSPSASPARLDSPGRVQATAGYDVFMLFYI